MTWVADLLGRVAGDVWSTMAADWPYLLLSILAAAAVPVYLGTDRLSRWLSQRRLPLTSPEELLLSAGLFGWPFAQIFSPVPSRLASPQARGRTCWSGPAGWLAGQARIRTTGCTDGGCPVPAPDPNRPSGCGSTAASAAAGTLARLRLPELARQLRGPGRRLALYFIGYSAIGYLLIELLPTGLLSGHSPASIALAAAAGVPVYITTEASLPMVAALVHGGLGFGPAMAFLVTGAGTSIGAITGAFVIARVIALVVALLFAGALILGGLTGAILG